MNKGTLIFTNYAKEVGEYLTLKLLDVPKETAMEISEFIANKTNNLVASVLYERDMEWRTALRKQNIKRIYRNDD